MIDQKKGIIALSLYLNLFVFYYIFSQFISPQNLIAFCLWVMILFIKPPSTINLKGWAPFTNINIMIMISMKKLYYTLNAKKQTEKRCSFCTVKNGMYWYLLRTFLKYIFLSYRIWNMKYKKIFGNGRWTGLESAYKKII